MNPTDFTALLTELALSPRVHSLSWYAKTRFLLVTPDKGRVIAIHIDDPLEVQHMRREILS